MVGCYVTFNFENIKNLFPRITDGNLGFPCLTKFIHIEYREFSYANLDETIFLAKLIATEILATGQFS